MNLSYSNCQCKLSFRWKYIHQFLKQQKYNIFPCPTTIIVNMLQYHNFRIDSIQFANDIAGFPILGKKTLIIWWAEMYKVEKWVSRLKFCKTVSSTTYLPQVF